MMKKYLNKILIITILITLCFCSVCFADEDPAVEKIQTIGNRLLTVIIWIGYAVALGMVVVIGIKYILGSADAKANMKSAIVNWFIGAFLVFACSTVIAFILNITGLKDQDSSDLPSAIINAVQSVIND